MAALAWAASMGSGTLTACVALSCDGAADPGAAALVRPPRFSEALSGFLGGELLD
jgi:hypothetical protein